MTGTGSSERTTGQESTLVWALFEGLGRAMLLCDADLTVVAANRVALEMLEIPLCDLIGKSAGDVIPSRASENAKPNPEAETLGWQSILVLQGRACRFDISGQRLTSLPGGTDGWALTLKRLSRCVEAPEFIGSAPVTRELLEFVSRIAGSRASSILLLGESGTGKELIAKRLHALSPRAHSPFVPINCAALPENLLESELFGYEKGAFTGAVRSKTGLLEAANGGTVFLDELGELPLPLQAKLLRFLEDQTFRRVGGTDSLSVDVRVVGATNAELEKAIEDRRFRSDLYYRLNTVQIRLPALRERVEDIRRLAVHFLTDFAHVHRRFIRGIHPAAQCMLDLHSWPGNVRELRNVIERAVLVESSSLITPGSLAIPARKDLRAGNTAAGTGPCHAPFSLRTGELELIVAALAETKGNQSRAAELLGIGRFSLRYKMKKMGLLGASTGSPPSRAAEDGVVLGAPATGGV